MPLPTITSFFGCDRPVSSHISPSKPTIPSSATVAFPISPLSPLYKGPTCCFKFEAMCCKFLFYFSLLSSMLTLGLFYYRFLLFLIPLPKVQTNSNLIHPWSCHWFPLCFDQWALAFSILIYTEFRGFFYWTSPPQSLQAFQPSTVCPVLNRLHPLIIPLTLQNTCCYPSLQHLLCFSPSRITCYFCSSNLVKGLEDLFLKIQIGSRCFHCCTLVLSWGNPLWLVSASSPCGFSFICRELHQSSATSSS